MEARNDRRAHDVPRIPLDVLVRLTHEDFDEPFDADGVDVSAGGLALRADYLPEVGDRLRCRFDCPPEGEEVELDGEVVWAHDAGERSGEFGLRFAELDVRAESALSRLVEHLGGAARDGVRPRARLHLEGVATPIDGEVLERDGGWLTVEQELPFLRIGMAVAVEGSGPAEGRLSSVDLRVEQGVPRLVLVVEDARARADDAIDAASDEARDEARSDAFDDAMDASAEAPSVESDATLQDFVAPDSASAADELDDELDEVVRAIEREPRAAREERSETNDAMPAAPPTSPLDRIGPMWARARASAIELAQKARPALAALWTKLALFFAKGLEKGGPRAKGAWLRAKTITTELAAKAASRVMRGKGKRRTTSAPPTRVAQAPKLRRQREEQQPAPAPKKSRRVIALSALAFAGVGATVYAFSGEDPAPPAAPVAITAPPVAPAPVEPAPAALDPEQGATALPAEASPEAPLADPRAMPAPESEAGRLGEPTFPSLQQAARPAQPAQPTQQPAQQAIINGGTSFGAAEVPNARPHTIRMSQPVASIRGEAQPDGFTVTVPGALALDRAAPIQAANPSIDQAMILNRGDHSVLTVRFVAGRNPPYRVVARGSAIEVSIGR